MLKRFLITLLVAFVLGGALTAVRAAASPAPVTATAPGAATASTTYFNAYVNGTSSVRREVIIPGGFKYAISWSSSRDGKTPCVTDLRMHNLSNGFERVIAKGGMVYGVFRGSVGSVGWSRWVFTASMSTTSNDNCLGHDLVFRP